jgi:anti-sigma factor RsiW
MTEHLNARLLNALADGELSTDDMVVAKEHLDICQACTSIALTQALLKTATAKAGQRYDLPQGFEEQLKRFLALQQAAAAEASAGEEAAPKTVAARWVALSGWAVAAVVLVVFVSGIFLYRVAGRFGAASAERAALVAEASDLHIAALAASGPPQVVSSDRHTVKPWFQGKIPFSFNLPESLPEDTKLDGANLTYLHNRPVAQLMYSIGRHRVSVFVQESSGAKPSGGPATEYAGFHVAGFRKGDLEVIAVSDVDNARLAGLVNAIEQVQTGGH